MAPYPSPRHLTFLISANLAFIALILVPILSRLHSDEKLLADANKHAEQEAAQAILESKWPRAGETWTNSLGLKFVPAGTDGILFCVYDVRVEDYQQFIQETGHDMSGGVSGYTVSGSAEKGYTTSWVLKPNASWQNPGFPQEPDCPVVGVSWNDANEFCQWLTQKEQRAGIFGTHQSYRLPKDQEWSRAVGYWKYPWGDVWPPPSGSGNYADEAWVASMTASMPGKGWPAGYSTVPGNDGYAHTSPVGSFHSNPFGLYDMGGNVWQWCDDWYSSSMNSDEMKKKFPFMADDGGGSVYMTARGGSWDFEDTLYLHSGCRFRECPGSRRENFGFRLVVEVSR